jgi:hypothetical protein
MGFKGDFRQWEECCGLAIDGCAPLFVRGVLSMGDNPSKQHKDRDTVLWQTYEVDYVVKQLCKEYPTKRRALIVNVVALFKKLIQPSEGHGKLIACARTNLDSRESGAYGQH